VAVQADWVEKDLYAVLGVAEDADSQTIKRAYRKLARQLHPDAHPDDPEAAEHFKEVTAAYDVIGDEAKRAEYDEFRRAVAGAGDGRPWRRGDGTTGSRGDGPTGSRGDGTTWTRFETGDFGGDQAWESFDGSTWSTFDTDGFDGFDDLLGSVLGRTRRQASSARRGNDLEAVLDLDFADAVHGLTTEVTINGPDGSRTFKVRVPAGVDDGQRIRLAGKGGPGSNGGPPGDLYAVVRVIPHPVFGRSGQDLTVDAPISWPEAVLGTEIDVPTLDGPPVRVRVPAGTPHGRTLRVRGRGVRTKKATGDLLVHIRLTVPVPDQLTEEQRKAVEAVAAAFRAA
jgi:molecular chaperone DnaJ